MPRVCKKIEITRTIAVVRGEIWNISTEFTRGLVQDMDIITSVECIPTISKSRNSHFALNEPYHMLCRIQS